MEKETREEIPLGCKNTGHPLASEVLEQKQKQEAMGENKRTTTAYPICSRACFLLFVIDGGTAFLGLRLHVVRVLFFVHCILFSHHPLVSGMAYPGLG
jgi:hypothetical protein